MSLTKEIPSMPQTSEIPQGRILYYRKDDQIPVEEDIQHEFKCHTAIATEDLPPWTQEVGARTKRAVSRSLNAFLNAEKGGTVFLGVMDTGVICGLELTIFQKDHLRVNLDNLMKRYTPVVSPDRYRTRFVPVISPDTTEDDVAKICLAIKKEEEFTDKEQRKRSHLCQTYEPCWCMIERKSMYSLDIPVQAYVVEIEIRPWVPQPTSLNFVTKISIQPFHANEEGIVCVRTLASVRQCTDDEIVSWTRRKVAKFYQMRIVAIKKQIKQYESYICCSFVFDT